MFLGKVDRLARVVTSLGEVLLFNRLEGSDGLSRNGEYRVTVLSRRGDIQADELLGRSVSTVVTTPRGTAREFNGLAVGFFQAGQQGRYHQYLIVVRPWTWLLTRTSDCKIFQEKTVREIISLVLADHPYADFEFQLTGSYTPWTYCVQYRETDFNFLARLMEQEGMHFFFRHQGGKHTLVIADGAQAHEAANFYDTLPYIEPEANRARQDEGVREWSHGSEIQPTRFVQRDFNFEKPRADMQADARPARPLQHDHAAAFEVFDYPGEYEDRSEGQRLATVRMEEMRYQFDVFNGESNAAGLTTGGLFRLSGHPRDDQNQEYLIVGADYHVEESPPESEIARTELFSIRFRAIPSAQSFQPPRLTPKPIVQGPQTAIVVGKAGEEIHTDKYGRVKVQFHWDRYGKKDENSSCWIRVSHPWAGQNWGMIAIPRTGQEVIVEFLEGDPDRPIITGRVYNADQMPPYALPANMTQTGIKTRSSKGGGVDNFNEIRFEDKKGAEQLYIHAEKNQDGVVENDETLSVGHDRKKSVGHNENVSVGKDRTESVGQNENISIAANRSLSVGANSSTNIGANHSLSVGANERHEVGGNRSRAVAKDETVDIGDHLSESVGKNVTVSIGENQSLTVGKDSKSQVGKKYYLEAGDELTLKTGDASITMKKDGTITIKGKDITIQGSGKIGIKAASDVAIKGSKIANN
jgi:type VI secretion system secreted protein VgrG